MNFERFLQYFTQHVESIIQWLFLFILALTGFLISRGLLSKKQDDGDMMPAMAGGGPSPELEKMLKTIMDRTQKLEGAAIAGLSPEAAALAETQVQALKKELSSRDEELKALKSSGGAGAATASEEAAKLNTRLKELESKLAEYEILEDDIADLSLYKEENTRLRSEIDKMKGGTGAAAPAPAAAAPAAAAAPTAPAPAAGTSIPAAEGGPPPTAAAAAVENPNVADDIVAEFAQAVNSQAVADPAEVTMQVPDTGNPMKDFEAAVKIEKKITTPASAAAPSTAATAAATAAAKPASGAASGTPPAKAPSSEGEAGDIFAEFADAPPDQGALDTDKMMAEMAALVNIEPADDSALDQEIDTEKMAAEATGTFGKR